MYDNLRKDIYSCLTSIIMEDLTENEKEIYDFNFDDNKSLLNDLDMDSLQIIKMVVDLEKKFNIQFDNPYELVENSDTIGELINYLHNLLTEG